MSIARSGRLTGRVIEEDSGKPIARLEIISHRVARESSEHGTTTDADGRFVISGLGPGDYLLQGPRLSHPLLGFSPDGLKAVDRQYERGRGGAWEFPVTAPSGASLDVGTLRMRSVVLYRVHLSLLQGTCPPRDTMRAGFSRQDGSNRDEIVFPCGNEFLLPNYEPGAYQIDVAFGQKAENRLWGSARFEVVDKNVGVEISLARGVDVEGRIVAADAAAQPPLDRIRVSMKPAFDAVDKAPHTSESLDEVIVPPDPEGRFRIFNQQVGAAPDFCFRPRQRPLPERSPLQRQRGVPSDCASKRRSLTHSIVLVIDDKPAAISGTVSDGDRPASGPEVVLVSWPVDSANVFLSVTHATGTDDGRFQFAGLALGEYRILAFPQAAKDTIEAQGMLERFLERAEKTTLAPGAFRNLSLQLTSPSW